MARTAIPSYEATVDAAARERQARRDRLTGTGPTLGDYAGRTARKAMDVLGAAFGGGSSVDPRYSDLVSGLPARAPAGGQAVMTPHLDPQRLSMPPAPAPAAPQAPAAPADTSRPVSAAASPAPPAQKGPAAGPETAMAAQAAGNQGEKPEPVRAGGQDYHDRVKAVKLPNGKIVFTNVPGAYEEKGASQMDYGSAIEGVTGRPFKGGVNVIQAEDGTTAFVQPGGEAATSRMLDQEAPPVVREEASTDPVAIFERQQFEDQRLAQEQAKASAAAGLASEQATARTRVAASEVDPLAAARLQAEAQYGGKMIDAEQAGQETSLALNLIGKIIAEQNRIRQTMPAGPEREAALEQLEQDKKLYLIAVRPQAASGLMRPDPYAAFGGMAPTPAAGAVPPK